MLHAAPLPAALAAAPDLRAVAPDAVAAWLDSPR
jgi:hypothetical protein